MSLCIFTAVDLFLMVINLPGRKWHLLIDLERLSLSSHPGAVGAGMSIAYSI